MTTERTCCACGEVHPTRIVGHEFDEDVNDLSMCRCGVPALYHDAIFQPEGNPT